MKPFFTPEDTEYTWHYGDNVGTKVDPVPMITIAKANALLDKHLEGLPVLEGNVEFDCWASEMDKHPEAHMSATHTCKAWGITPIQPEKVDSANELLKDFVQKCEGIKYEPNSFTRLDLSELYDRAKALLSKDK